MSWHVPVGLRYFKESTVGCPITMGRCSWEVLGCTLPGRTSIVIARRSGYRAEGALVVSSAGKALRIAREETVHTDVPYIWITDGAQLYAETPPLLDEAVVIDLELDAVANASEGSIFAYASVLDPALWCKDGERGDAE